MKRAFFLLASAFLLLGCVTPTPLPDATATPTPTSSPTASPMPTEAVTPSPTVTPGGSTVQPTVTSTPIPDHGPPTTRTSARPSNPDRGEPFTLTLSAEDDVGIKALSWETADAFSKQPESNSFDCASQKNCSVSWEFISAQDGAKKIMVYATDSSNQDSSKTPMEITVRPFDYKPRASPSPTPAAFACANGKCEGGESFQSCPQDCSVSSAAGATCGDGACSPGEDAGNCASDCAVIKPNCGNNVCDAGETTSSCSADCAQPTATEKACSSNSACGYKQICQSGKCVSVDCTNDGQCGYGKECESNRCVRCPSGPYGPAC